MTPAEELRHLEGVVVRLQRRFPRWSEGFVRRTVMASRDTLDGARLREFVPLLVEREARDVLALMDASLRAGEDGCGR